MNLPIYCLVLICYHSCSLFAFHRTWTSLVSAKSWRNMTKSWILLVGPTGVWLTWRWRRSTPARRSHSSYPRQRCLLTYTQADTHTLWYKDIGGKQNIYMKSWMFVSVCVLDPRHQWTGGRRSSEGNEEVESSSTRGSSGQNYSWFHWKALCDMYLICSFQTVLKLIPSCDLYLQAADAKKWMYYINCFWPGPKIAGPAL